MGLSVGITTGIVVGHSGVTLMARVLGQGGQPITRASLSAIAYTVFDVNAGVSLGAGTFAVASCVFDSLVQGDPRWTKDSAQAPGADNGAGYNFLAVLPAALFPAAAIGAAPRPYPAPQPRPGRVQCEVTFTPASGEIFAGVWQWTPIPRFS